MSCEHERFDVSFEVLHIEEAWPPIASFRYARINVRCASCEMLFSWRGLPSGLPNEDGPVVSADGYELRAPIVPGPGAVVGLLSMAGMTDVLRNET